MTPTRKYLDNTNVKPNLPALVIGFLLITLIIGGLVLANIEVWSSIFN